MLIHFPAMVPIIIPSKSYEANYESSHHLYDSLVKEIDFCMAVFLNTTAGESFPPSSGNTRRQSE